MPVEIAFTPTLRIIGDAQKADDAELAVNPRARSAVLRVAERLAGEAARSRTAGPGADEPLRNAREARGAA